MIDKAKFYSEVKKGTLGLFSGSLTQPQVDGFEAILDEWEASGYTDIRWLAYLLATTHHETNKTFQPVREAYWLSEAWRKANLRYYPYYGRGYVQLTWAANYDKQGKKYNLPLVANPDLVMDPKVAAKILIHGSVAGDFTTKKLSDYFNDRVDNPIEARRIINGTDKASLISGYHIKYLKALTASVVSKQPSPLPPHQPTPETSPVTLPEAPEGTPEAQVGTGTNSQSTATRVSVGAAILAAIIAAVTAILKANGLM